jgi:hypothetical protein
MSTVVTIIVDNKRIEGDDLESLVNQAITDGAKYIRHVNGIILYDMRNRQHLSRTDHLASLLETASGLSITVWFYKSDGKFRILSGVFEGVQDSEYFTLNLRNDTFRRVRKDTIINVDIHVN